MLPVIEAPPVTVILVPPPVTATMESPIDTPSGVNIANVFTVPDPTTPVTGASIQSTAVPVEESNCPAVPYSPLTSAK